MELIRTDFVHVGLDVPDQAALFDVMAGALIDRGRVRPSYRQAIEERESVFPTGLPVGIGVAIPHTDAEHVIEDTIAIATLATPVVFGEMAGEADATVEARAVIMLALASGSQVEVLKRVIKAIQNAEFMDALVRAGEPAEVMELATVAFLPQD
ncbi:MAG: PTS sugar transporter subunit IIA [Tessaracoccus sp.]